MAHTLIHNGLLIDGNGGAPIQNGAVLIRDNRIVSAGSTTGIQLPDEHVTRIDANGGTILPGFIDTHVHMMLQISSIEATITRPFSMNFYNSVQYMRRTLDAGITTVRDAGGADLGVKTAIEQGVVPGPRMQISITPLGITGGHVDGWNPSGMVLKLFKSYPGMPEGICDGVEEVRKKVREVLRAGAEVIKVCSTGGVLSPTDHPQFTQFTVDELKVMVEEGRMRNGVRVMSHAQGSEGIKNAILAGIHSIEHGIYITDEIIDLMLEHETFLVPTLLAPVAVVEAGESSGKMPEYGLRKAKEVIEDHTESIARAHAAGVKIAMGTDAGVMPHGTNLRELGLMCRIGMSPMEAIVATTKVAAECLGWEDQVGTLDNGKFADIVITKTNPLDNIQTLEDTENIVLVIKNGEICKNLMN